MKKFLALILALMMALSLVACGGTGTSGDDAADGGDAGYQRSQGTVLSGGDGGAVQ